MKAIRVHQPGGIEALKYEEVPLPQLGPQQALVKVAAIGVNFIDVYHRTGLYKTPLPFSPGSEAAGVVEAIGGQVTEVKLGDRVAYCSSLGAYAEYAAVPAAKLVHMPEDLSFDSAAAAMLQGMTAHYLVHSTYALKPGHTCLIHAAAGGVGLLLIQMAKRLGANVIGTVSTQPKAALGKDAGADEIIIYTEQDFEAEVRRMTNGNGVEVVYDSVGKSTYEKSLSCLRPRGCLVLFGQSSGAVPPLDPLKLSAKGSLYLTRPTIASYTANREELLWRANDVFNWIASGAVRLRIDRILPLEQAGEAHRLLESRQTSGKLLLHPQH